MSHELDTLLNGAAAFAFRAKNGGGWHGLGTAIGEGEGYEAFIRRAFPWEAVLADVLYQTRETLAANAPALQAHGMKLVYRSDTGAALGVVSDQYKPVQPRESVEFFQHELCEKYGLELDTAGALKGGRIVWAQADAGQRITLPGGDSIERRMLFSTSFDGSRQTRVREVATRVVCNNTLGMSDGETGRREFGCNHRSEFRADEARRVVFGLDAWQRFEADAHGMAGVQVDPAQAFAYFLKVYHSTTPAEVDEARRQAAKDDKAAKLLTRVDKTMARLAGVLADAPGQRMSSASGTLWGLLNAVTYDVDHAKPARSEENRTAAAWFGEGDTLKSEAYAEARRLLGPAPALLVPSAGLPGGGGDGGELGRLIGAPERTTFARSAAPAISTGGNGDLFASLL